jgi:hypothetical protein
MNSQMTGLRVASIVFALMAVAQLLRMLIRPEVLVAGYSMPLWPSMLAFASSVVCVFGCGDSRNYRRDERISCYLTSDGAPCLLHFHGGTGFSSRHRPTFPSLACCSACSSSLLLE